MVSSLVQSGRSVPFIHEHFLLGSYQEFLQNRLGFITQLAEKGDVLGFRVGPMPFLFFNKPEYAQHILVEQASDFSKGRLMRKAVSNNGLFVSEGELYRRQRKLMAPSFQPRHIASYADTIVGYAERIMQEWEDGAIIDIDHYMIRFTMSIIGKIVLATTWP